ncbi:KH homology domain-containing protein 4-like [Paramormyrops kingsleyae]|uniref:KH homology domain-containing protein 4-like n=1 Tax=Paramormyrops kingsleyae TaxID=1676925 RepID=UPI000CD5DD8F|nr:protein BLOM7-like [Paramormyrops kingsleyae]
MASGMAGQTSCLNSRWDQPGPAADMLKGLFGNISTSLTTQVASLPSYTGGCLASSATNGLTLAGGMGSTAPPVTSQPTPTSPEEEKPSGGVEMAAAMAAKINAMLMAKGKLKTPPPLHCKVAPRITVASTASESVVTEVDINDVPINCRNLLTKGKTQEEIRQYSGAVVSTKGHYMTSAEKAQCKSGDRPLYLHVQGKSQEEVSKAVKHIKEIISEDILRSSAGQSRPVMPTLPVYTQPPKPLPPAQPPVPPPVRPPVQPHLIPSPPQNQKSPASYNCHSGNFVHTKVFVGLDQALPSFNVNEKVEGPSGSYLQHIQAETGARVFLRGKGSGYIEQASRRESFEPLYLYISHPNPAGLEAARELCESLVQTVRAEHSRMVSVYTATGSTQAYPSHGYPDNNNYGSHVSWYNYPANSYTGGYAAYPGSSGYWSSANGAPGHSNFSTTPQSSQAMVQYPVCPRKPPSYLAPDTGTSYSSGTDGCSSSPPRAASPKRRFLEGSEEECGSQHGSISAAVLKKEQPAADTEGGEATQRMLMPPPAVPAGLAPRKRPREGESQPCAPDPKDKVEPDSLKKARPLEGAPGLVPYGGDSSDEEDDRTRSSKKS